ncbi:MobP2 family relaxase [Lactococcus allomyrinae]|uniref:Relaxase n=1 Tax=Lactococcus allomyrinae TaxID=2419773 RepID=A0A387BEY8_9LACT|nr:MobP2 family relaxase [Lactococcus allomyrinae]AYG01138.1 hypothetical protein D7I46_08545 [Lactococcus allomyrinae]
MIGIVYKMKFVSSVSQKFADYINYMDRDSATRASNYERYTFAFDDLKESDLATYNDYMGRPQAASNLFSSNSDALTEEETKQLKAQFQVAQQNHSLMWQDVVSFDNRFLEKYGLYDSKTGILDDTKLQQAARLAITDMLAREGMSNSAIWSGAIHYNTDNIHIHIAIVEPEPTRSMRTFRTKEGRVYRDYIGTRRQKAGEQSSYERFKSMILEHMIDNSEKSRALSELQRNVITSKNKPLVGFFDLSARQEFKALHRALPSDKRLWHYRMSAMEPYRATIDQFVERYIEKNYKQEFKQFNHLLDEQVTYFKEAYGDSRAEDYKQNKLYGKDGLYTKLGNDLLKELNTYDEKLKEKYHIKGYGKVELDHLPKQRKQQRFSRPNYKLEHQLKTMFDKSWEEQKREFAAEKFKRELEKEKDEAEI